MKLKLTWLMTLFMALVMNFSFGQEKTITGTVTTAEDGLPLPGATVLVKGTTRGTQTDFDGRYSITASVGETLVFSYVGSKNVEMLIGNSNSIDVAMESDNQLEEVVIVGYGTSTRQAFSGSAATVSAENIEAKNFANVSQALQGEVAGAQVFNASGQPGTIGTVRIRGFGSPLGNRDPLYVVDGIPFAGDFNINSINPADIKSTTILKDATATAIYGSRGANGVVLITTKTGSRAVDESYVQVDVQSGVVVQQQPRYDVLTNPDEYIGLVWEGLFNSAVVDGISDPIGFANSTLLGDNGIGAGYNMWNVGTAAELIDPNTRSVRPGVQRLFTPLSYAEVPIQTGRQNEVNVQVGGGNEKTQYFFSTGYFDQEGYSINTNFTRYNTRINLTTQVKEWLQVTANMNYAYSEDQRNGQAEDAAENIFEFADKMAPIYPVFARFPNSAERIPDPIFGGFQYDYGSPTATLNGFDRARPNANLLNPVGAAVYDFVGTQTHSINGNLGAIFKILPGLQFETTYGAQYSMEELTDVNNHIYGTAANPYGNIVIRDRLRWSQTFTNLLRYKNSFGDHNFEALAAYETFEQRFEQDQAFKENVIIPGLYTLDNYSLLTAPPSGYQNGSGIESIFGQVNYNYQGKYFLTGSIRTDGSSRFVNEKWGTFGSIGASWVASNEAFLDDSVFSFLKLKASYGTTGDQQGVSTSRGFTIFNTTFVDGSGLAISENRPGDADLTWETSRQLNTGIELSLGNWLDANFDYYRKNTDNLFFNQRRGPSVGFSSILVNDGEILNAGFEFDLTARIINNENFKFSLNLNGAMLNNEITNMPLDVTTGLPRVLDSGSSPDSGIFAYAEGKSIFDMWMREYAGVNPDNGEPLWFQYYDDANNNDVLDPGEGDFFVDDGTGSNANGSNSLFEYRQLVSDANIKRETTNAYADGTQVFIDKSGIPDVQGAFRLSAQLGSFDFSTQFTYSLNLGTGRGTATVWTCDLSHDYISINAEYRT